MHPSGGSMARVPLARANYSNIMRCKLEDTAEMGQREATAAMGYAAARLGILI